MDLNAPIEVLQRIAVNYLRHCLTHYEDMLYSVSGNFGADRIRITIKSKILNVIAEAYPYLKEECISQGGEIDDGNNEIDNPLNEKPNRTLQTLKIQNLVRIFQATIVAVLLSIR